LRDFAEQWLTEYVAQERKPKGHDLAKQRLEDYVLPFFGDLPIRSIQTTHLRRLRGSLDRTDLSVQSVRHVLGDVRTLLRYAVEVDVIPASPWKVSLMPKLPEQLPRPLSEKDEESVLAACPERYALAVRLSLLTGLRWSELHRLRWADVRDLPSPHLVVEKTKNGKVRRVPLTEEAVKLLERERRRSESPYVNPWRTTYAATAVKTIRRRSGVRFTWHQLRHTFACRWLDAGGSIESLQRILGHSTVLVTERYGRMSDATIFAEARALGSSHGTKHGTGRFSPRPEGS
jgi:integrase